MDGLGQQVRIRITFATMSGMFVGFAWCFGIAAFFMWFATRR